MIINEAGEYTLQYTATDACGNTTTVERELTVEAPPTYRTVLYTDGTFIINESDRDEAANVQAHGQPTNVYVPFDPNGATNVDKYIFANAGARPWNSQASSIKSVEIGSNISPTSTANWFRVFTTCTSIDLSLLDTSNVTNMRNMFYSCQAITTLDVSNFNTSNVADMSYMFYDCLVLTALDVSNFNTSNVTDMSYMFYNCQVLTALDVSSFNTSNVTDMSYMFSHCNALGTLDLSGFNTGNVTTMERMFESCASITTLDLSGFNTSNVTTFYMMFRYCEAIVTIDVSGFDTLNATNMKQMFNYCRVLKTIYASSDFVTSGVTDGTGMFASCSNNLKGGAGTVWSSSNVDKTYARIDNPPSAPGYFTARS